ncbi:MAG: hypothetical protein WBQ82_07380 [Methyloceanibacter sp.]
MTSFDAPAKLSRQILMLTAGIFLLAATQGALAKNKDHSDDQGGMSSNDSKQDHGDKHSEDRKDKVSDKHKGKHNEQYAEEGMNSEKHKGKDKKHAEEGMNSEKHKGKHKEEYAEKKKDKDKHKTPGSTASNNPPAPGTGGTNTIHPIPSPAPVASSSGAPGDVTPPVNTIHPILSPVPVASSSGGPAGVTPPVNTIVRDHRHPPAGDVGPQPGVKPDGYTPFEDETVGGHFWKGVGDFGYGITHGLLGGGPAPEDPTSTSTQY